MTERENHDISHTTLETVVSFGIAQSLILQN